MHADASLQSGVPPLPDALEERLPTLLEQRLGHPGNADELAAYRRFLWAYGTAVYALIEAARRDIIPSPPHPCSAPLSISANPPNRTTGKR